MTDPQPVDPNTKMLLFFEDQLLAQMEDPLAYTGQLLNIVATLVADVMRNHFDCKGCPICPALDDLGTLAQAHNGLQLVDPQTQQGRPYPLLKGFTRIHGDHA
ncbi:hypothetical protein [Actinoplanes sp. NPDC051411]|uniref:hypothetical protein n=1 Tax=Actinoplanes sp. NPDC051411 TaxID=3155522 RepID=UPI0034422526